MLEADDVFNRAIEVRGAPERLGEQLRALEVAVSNWAKEKLGLNSEKRADVLEAALKGSKEFSLALATALDWDQPLETSAELSVLAVNAIREGTDGKFAQIFGRDLNWQEWKKTHDLVKLQEVLSNNSTIRNELSREVGCYPSTEHLHDLAGRVTHLLPDVSGGISPQGQERPFNVLKKRLLNWGTFAISSEKEGPQESHLKGLLKEDYLFRQAVAIAVGEANSEAKELAHLAVEMWRAIPAKQFVFFGPGRTRIFGAKDRENKRKKIPKSLLDQETKPSDEAKRVDGDKPSHEEKTAGKEKPDQSPSWGTVECNLAVEFAEDPQKAVDLWDVMEWPYPFSLVLRAELAQVEMRRMKAQAIATETSEASGTAPATRESGEPSGEGSSPHGVSGTSTKGPVPCPEEEIRDASDRAARRHLFGVAFSGGGIRSATFNLGVLQELAKFGLLSEADYLSTVSGGGYIGSWLTGWIYKNQFPSHKELREGVQKLLSPRIPDPRADEQKPVRFLREFSNYLTPRLGTFSFDTWTMVSIYSRNLLLNQATLISVLGFLLLLPRFMAFSLTLGFSGWWAGVPAFLLLLWTVGGIAVNISAVTSAADPTPTASPNLGAEPALTAEPQSPSPVRDHVQSLVVAPFLAAMYLGSVAIWQSLDSLESHPRILLGSAFGIACCLSFLLLWLGGFIREYRRRSVGSSVWLPVLVGIVILCAGAMSGLLESDVAITSALKPGPLNPRSGEDLWIAVVFSPIMLLAVMLIPALLQVGLMGVDFPDAGREWLSRFRAICTVYSLWWMILFSTAIFGPRLMWILAGKIGYWFSGITAGWILTTVGGILAGQSKRTGTDKDGTPKFSWLQILAGIGPPVFAAGLVLLMATAEEALLAHGSCVSMGIGSLRDASWMTLDGQALFCRCGWYVDQPGWLLLVLLAAGIILSWRVDVNEFSMHHFYKNRLVRCYLGASNESRRPNEFTGFDARDDVRLARLKAIPDKNVIEQPDAKDGEKPYLGPYPIINTTLNLSAGKQLAWQERKGASFILTPCFCGFDVQGWESSTAAKRASLTAARKKLPRVQHEDEKLAPAGYRKTSSFSHEDGPYLGTSFSISGAAANPNQGYNTSPAVAFLMTMFDVRLGWWFGNPRRKNEWRLSGPAFGLKSLLDELMGLTDDTYAYVNLSDGGHFDNMGIYELVRRRCSLIVLCDAEQDQDFKFEGLGSAIRKCRIDFGACIEIDTSLIRPGKEGNSRAHCAVGRIVYLDGSEGTLVYIKASLTGDEPADVTQYHCAHPDFPHESTADQWFTESQFESYRALGLHATEESLQGAGAWIKWKPEEPELCELVKALRNYWYADNPNLKDNASRNTATLVKMLDTIRETQDLRQLGNKLFPGITAPPPGQSKETQEFYFGLALLQLIEDIYFDFKLDRDEWLNDPRIGGWKDLFETWKAVPEVAMVWASTRTTFRKDFQHFWEERIQGRR